MDFSDLNPISTIKDESYSTASRPTTTSLPHSTTSFLTATTLIYAIGAGITAAAGHLLSQHTGLNITSHFLLVHRPFTNLRNSAPWQSTLTGGLARSLSKFKETHPHLSARYDGHALPWLATRLTI